MAKVNNIVYEVEGDATTHPDGVTLDVRLYKDGNIVWEEMKAFSGHSCVDCPGVKLPMEIREYKPMIDADMVEIIAHDIESESQYIRVNNTRFHIPVAENDAIITYQFSLQNPMWIYIFAAVILFYLLTRG